MINSLGLLAPLTGAEPAPPVAASDDPALFAAALAAALGLTPPVAVTAPAAPPPVTTGELEAEADAETPADGDAQPETFGATVTADRPDTEVARGALGQRVPKRVVLTVEMPPPLTPEAGASRTGQLVDVKEAKAATPVAPEATHAAASVPATIRCRIPQPIEESVQVLATVTETTATLAGSPVSVVPPAQRKDRSGELTPLTVPIAAPDESSTLAAKTSAAVPQTPGASAPVAKSKRGGSSTEPDAAPAPAVAPEAVPAPLVSSAAPALSIGQQPESPRDISQSVTNEGSSATHRTDRMVESRPRARGDAPHASSREGPSAPAQSKAEQTARAMAENSRVGRQLADLLGDADVIDVRVQLASRRGQVTVESSDIAVEAPVAPPLADAPAPVRWQRADPGASIVRPALVELAAEATVPEPLRREGENRTAGRAVVGQEGDAAAVKAAPLISDPVTMVAPKQVPKSNAERVTADLAPLERAVRLPAAPSLPVDRQELPATAGLTNRTVLAEPEPKRSRTAEASDAVPASSALDANRTAAGTRDTAPAETRGSSEARNLPSDGSTDAKAAGSSDRVTLQVADDEGRQTRIRVTVTGTQIRAVITPPDNASARQLEQRMDQLTETLIRQGYADPKVTVRTAAEAMGDQAVALSTAGGAQDVRSAGPASREQPAGDNRQGRGQRDQDRSGDGHRHPQGQPRDRDPRDRRK